MKKLIIGLILILNQSLLDARIFTNTSGKTIEAEIVSADLNKNQVTLKISSSGAQYSIPINSLISEDRTYITSFIKAQLGYQHPRNWVSFKISLPETYDEVESPGIYGAFYRVAASTWAGELPVGAFVKVRLNSTLDGFVRHDDPTVVFRYDGSTELSITYDGDVFYLTTPTNKKIAIGVSLNRDETELIKKGKSLTANSVKNLIRKNPVFYQKLSFQNINNSSLLGINGDINLLKGMVGTVINRDLDFDAKSIPEINRLQAEGLLIFRTEAGMQLTIPSMKFFQCNNLETFDCGLPPKLKHCR